MQAACWSTPLKRLVVARLWSSLSIYLFVFFVLYLTLNSLGEMEPEKRWQERLKAASKWLGCYAILTATGAAADEDAEDEE